jgi:hypothetical protein
VARARTPGAPQRAPIAIKASSAAMNTPTEATTPPAEPSVAPRAAAPVAAPPRRRVGAVAVQMRMVATPAGANAARSPRRRVPGALRRKLQRSPKHGRLGDGIDGQQTKPVKRSVSSSAKRRARTRSSISVAERTELGSRHARTRRARATGRSAAGGPPRPGRVARSSRRASPSSCRSATGACSSRRSPSTAAPPS